MSTQRHLLIAILGFLLPISGGVPNMHGQSTKPTETQVPSANQIQKEIHGCIASGPTTSQLECLSKYYQQLDSILNQVYSDLSQALPKERIASLKAAERSWVTFRDANSAFEASESSSGSLAGIEQMGSKITMSGDRARYLSGISH